MFGFIFLLTVGLFLIFYSVIPTVLIRRFSVGIIKKGEKPDTLSLTFDDGPHPVYTPKVLDLLKQYQVSATFFVVGENALKYPHLLKRMVQEGHTIGIHHHRHISSWVLSPFRLRKEIHSCASAIERITETQPVFYRPPWGHFNPFTLFVARPYKIVMWSSISKDWKIEKGTSTLARRLINDLESGKIYLLHDSGDTFGADSRAPEIMIDALREFVIELKSQNYDCVSLEKLLEGKTHYSVEQKRSV